MAGNYRVAHVKEKYGSLRVHLHPLPADTTPVVSALLIAAEHASLRTCEFCGQPGRPQAWGPADRLDQDRLRHLPDHRHGGRSDCLAQLA